MGRRKVPAGPGRKLRKVSVRKVSARSQVGKQIEKGVICPYCSAVVKRQLQRHINSVHLNVPVAQCHECTDKRWFKSKEAFKKHHESFHSSCQPSDDTDAAPVSANESTTACGECSNDATLSSNDTATTPTIASGHATTCAREAAVINVAMKVASNGMAGQVPIAADDTLNPLHHPPDLEYFGCDPGILGEPLNFEDLNFDPGMFNDTDDSDNYLSSDPSYPSEPFNLETSNHGIELVQLTGFCS